MRTPISADLQYVGSSKGLEKNSIPRSMIEILIIFAVQKFFNQSSLRVSSMYSKMLLDICKYTS